MNEENTIYVVRNIDGSRRIFRNLPVLMTQKEIKSVSDKDHTHSNISSCDPVWVDYNSIKNTMNPGSKIGNPGIIDAMGIDYKNMDCNKIYKVNVYLNEVLTK